MKNNKNHCNDSCYVLFLFNQLENENRDYILKLMRQIIKMQENESKNNIINLNEFNDDC
ncbi:hypothetical protein MUJ63_04910 [Lachnospiraceae bacterium NSJ-143]|nr:hypothetical protein [Lachnospiraceae bacterium NSJ-143]